MLKNYIKIALRNMLRYKTYTLINITGLVLGLTSFILITLWVQDELNYDRFHNNADDIYRVVFADETYDKERHYSVTPPALAKALKKNFPEIEYSTKYYTNNDILVGYQNSKFKQIVAFTDASVFNIFSLKFITGNPETAFKNPYSLIITKKMAKKYFRDENPINKTLLLNNKTKFEISGVIEDLPNNSSLKFDFITQFDHLEHLTGRGNIESWDSFGYDTFILLNFGTDLSEFDNKIAEFAVKSHSYGSFKPRLYTQPFTSIHLYNLNGGGPIIYIYIFSVIAMFVLAIACINYMNLASARSITRAKEVGMRKIVGAQKKNLIFQFFGESILMTLLSLSISLFLVEYLLPYFNTLSGKTLSLGIMTNLYLIPTLIGIALITGIISGSYPAIFLSSFKPVNILKSSRLSGSSGLRKILVVFQFSLSILLIICTIVVSDQINYMRSQKLGFDKEHVLYFPLNNKLKSKNISLRNELLQNSQITFATVTSSKIGIHAYHSVDMDEWEGNNKEKSILLNIIYAGYDFPKTFNIEMTEGRYFSPDFTTDSSGIILNETAINEMGIEDPLGKKIFKEGHIIGIIKDFNFKSLHSKVEPLALVMDAKNYKYLALKSKSEDVDHIVAYAKSVMLKFDPDLSFEYYFLDKEFDQLYRSEQRLGTIFNYFSFLAIFISCLGLIGLAYFLTEQRLKEIGIRKVLGAPVFQILYLLIKNFTQWVLMANLIAWPLGWYFMKGWLQNFAYQTNLGWWIFIFAGGLACMIAIIATGSLVLRAVFLNPIKIIRYE